MYGEYSSYTFKLYLEVGNIAPFSLSYNVAKLFLMFLSRLLVAHFRGALRGTCSSVQIYTEAW